MRKKIIFYVITALCLFVSASPWEGAAAVAPEGELPASGRYIATNSFPRNTVVDILNIETNKSTRVIVAGNLESPGLLAIVSRESAELIGMRPGSVSRIRMTQPSDPVAYVRFTEGLSTGIPDYDSGEVISEDSYEGEFVNPASAPSRVSSAPPADTDSYSAYSAPAPAASVPETGYPSYMLEPEWGGARSSRDIVDLPSNAVLDKKPEAPAPSYYEGYEEIAEAEPEETEITTEDASDMAAEYFPEDDYYEEIAEAVPEDEYYEDDFIDEPDEIAEADDIFDEIIEDDYFNAPEEVVEYIIVPSDERPPASIYGIDPAFIIPGISSAAKSESANNQVINPVKEPGLSASVKNELSRGSYYVQLASFDTAESAENGLTRIDQHYKPVVYNESGKYRILLGPLNQGESAAVLARFKSIGYKDAFVKVAR